MAGYEFFKAIPAYLGSPFLFWHEEGEKYSTFPQQFWRKINREIVPYAKAKGVDFRPFRFHDLRHLHAIEFLKSRSGTIHELKHRLGHSSITLLTDAEIHWALYGRPMTGDQSTAAGVA